MQTRLFLQPIIMLNTLSQRILKAANGKSLLFFLLLFIAFEVFFGIVGGKIEAVSNGASVLDLAMAYSPEDAYNLYLNKYSVEGHALYLKAECVDLFFPIAYSCFLALLISLGIKRFPEMPPQYRLLNLLPFAGGLADYMENIGIFSLLLTYPEKHYNMALWASGFGTLKWMTIFACVLLGLGSLGLILIRRKEILS